MADEVPQINPQTQFLVQTFSNAYAQLALEKAGLETAFLNYRAAAEKEMQTLRRQLGANVKAATDQSKEAANA